MLNEDQAKAIIAADSAETKIKKAAEILAARKAAEQAAVTEFLKRHVGTLAANSSNGIYYDCTANARILSDYLQRNGLSLSNADDIERAFQACKAAGSLAEYDNAPHVAQMETVPATTELREQHMGDVPAELTNSSTPDYVRRKDREAPSDSVGQLSSTHRTSTVIPIPTKHLSMTRKEIGRLNADQLLSLYRQGYRSEVTRILSGK